MGVTSKPNWVKSHLGVKRGTRGKCSICVAIAPAFASQAAEGGGGVNWEFVHCGAGAKALNGGGFFKTMWG